MRAPIASILLLTLNSGISFGQHLIFTSRASLQSPITFSSIESSRNFGFDSVLLRNGASDTITAVHFKITLGPGTDGEVADERRVPVRIEPSASKRVITELGHVESIKQLLKSRNQTAPIVILTIDSVEFETGVEWRQPQDQLGVPLDVPDRK